MVDHAEYTYEIIDNPSDARLCAQLLAEAFALHNPMTIFHQMSTQQYYDALMMPIINKVLDERLSVLARHRLSGEIVGALVAGDMVLHISVGGTLASHSNKGVATGLRKFVCAHARNVRGFQYAFVQVNNEAT